MQQVDLERTGDVVDAVAVLRIRPRALRVLEDAELAAENLQVLPADRVERRQGSVATASSGMDRDTRSEGHAGA